RSRVAVAELAPPIPQQHEVGSQAESGRDEERDHAGPREPNAGCRRGRDQQPTDGSRVQVADLPGWAELVASERAQRPEREQDPDRDPEKPRDAAPLDP